MPTRTEHRSAAIAATVVAVFAALIFAKVPSARAAVLLSNVGQCLAPALAAAAGVRASTRATTVRLRRGWLLLGASAASWSLGQVVWTYYEVSGAAAPFPSLADVGYLAAVPLAMLSVGLLAASPTRSARLVAGLDGLLLAGSLLAISWPLVLGPSWDAGGDDPLTFALSLAYPVGTLVVASTVLLALMRAGGRGSVPLGRIAAGLLVLAGADSIFVWSTLKGTEQQISPSDVGWVGGYVCILLAALAFPTSKADHEEQPQVQERAAEAPSLYRALLPLGTAGLALGVRVVLLVAGHHDDPFLDGVSVAVVALVLARHLVTMRENQDLTRSLEEKIHQLTAREEQLSHQAFHDPLTGLANRRLFGDRVDHALARSRRTDERTAVLFIDLDDFKVVNDSLGHAAGDRLLVAVGSRISGCVRPGDTVSRLGGDEFGVLLEELETLDRAVTVANRILEALEVPFPVDGRQVFTRASIGLALAEQGDRPDGDHLLADADAALYAAKAAGKATFRRFETEMRSTAMARLELGQDLRRAVQEEQFLCHYQPIVDLVSGRVVAMEALVRWDHPERGLLSPDTFIPLAEATGGINAIGAHVLRTATGHAAAWRRSGAAKPDLELHVNLSGRQLEEADLVAQVRRELERSGFPPDLLVLEITESVAVDVGARHLERLVGLQQLGVRLAIDDFGTGYSSLNYLRTLPVEVLKIDRAFAQTIDGATDPVLLEAIVQLGHSLGIDVVAEGIEREDQAATLRRMGCRRAQGYLFRAPVPAAEVPALLASGSLLPPPASSGGANQVVTRP
ncbi:bifunctional diguanylate cyclase/phosphodiesterase [Aquihabitans sp. G128]|uniref:putative bifunctional diguanylate cyclase/phosphodiesterase n=1 Tax=Aquihabitans sp. G128 TaxID=2849779 RepID=UPI001C215A96|nr:bifunctional diguanylate cyclase/phosphodiesterase [Aquihabitans sp. G128]QXC59301.1 bifunctional diguanylate cyclase/phosphodiesterase [Aquihabitans sp. G128]